MEPTIDEGDWLLVDPTTAAGPAEARSSRSTSPTAARSPSSASPGRPGDRIPFREGYLELADDEAWLIADARRGHDDRGGLGAADRFAPLRAGAGRSPRRARLVPLRAPSAPRPRSPGSGDDRTIGSVDGGGPSRVASPAHRADDPLSLTGTLDRMTSSITSAPRLLGVAAVALVAAACGATPAASTPAAPSTSPATTASSAPSVAPSASASASASAAASASAGASVATTGRIVIPDQGFAVTLPNGWTRIDLAAQDMDALIEAAGAQNPQLAQSYTQQIDAMAAQGLVLFAFGPDMTSGTNRERALDTEHGSEPGLPRAGEPCPGQGPRERRGHVRARARYRPARPST